MRIVSRLLLGSLRRSSISEAEMVAIGESRSFGSAASMAPSVSGGTGKRPERSAKRAWETGSTRPEGKEEVDGPSETASGDALKVCLNGRSGAVLGNTSLSAGRKGSTATSTREMMLRRAAQEA